ncbi:hypothetical protein ACTXOU_14380 [Psychrobacter glacincola]
MKLFIPALLAAFVGVSMTPVANAAYGPNEKVFPKCSEYKKRKSGLSGKEGAKTVPSWVTNEGYRPCKRPNETGNQFADRAIRLHYNTNNYQKGADTEFNKIQKFGDRSFE